MSRQRPAIISRSEVESIRTELARALGARGHISDDYLFNVLGDLGARVAPELGGVSPEIRGLLRFDTLEAAEATIRALDERAHTGPDAAADCRRAAQLARRRATLIARNPRVAPEKRTAKEEIAQWFDIWLQTPDIFFDWLEVRKRKSEVGSQ